MKYILTRVLVFWFNDYYKKEYTISNAKAQESFRALCSLLDNYLDKGDYCELYICWAGDEKEERNTEFDQSIYLNNYEVNKVQIYEKTLLVLQK